MTNVVRVLSTLALVGSIPHYLQTPAVFSAGRMAASKRAVQAEALLEYLAAPEVAPVLRQSRLEP